MKLFRDTDRYVPAPVALMVVGVGTAQSVAVATLSSPDGTPVGYVTLSEVEGVPGMTVVGHVVGLEPGYHGFHIYENGTCEPDFGAAGGHYAPFGNEHGLANPAGPHAGDMPNLLVNPNGVGTIVTQAPLVTLGAGDGSLFKEGGTAIIVHGGADNLRQLAVE